MKANNNLDVLRHSDGRIYLAWRTAPDHFASRQTLIQVASSEDERTWRLERTIARGTDLREPRLLSLHGSLFLYMTELGQDRLSFEPHGVFATELRRDGTWSEVASIGLPGYVAWRARVDAGTPHMLAYRGGANIYRFNGQPLNVDLLTTRDGWHWQPVDPSHRSVYVGGGSEADFALDRRGALYGVIRNEAGDASGFGSKLCVAPPGRLSAWRCTSDRRKFDSPRVFERDGEIYVLARRNVSPDGAYDHVGPFQLFKSVRNQLAYVTLGKRCALWHFARETRKVEFVLDLPSRGDTCFPAIAEQRPGAELAVYDYSSAIDGADVPWSVGQRQPTYIYRHALEFTSRAAD